MFFVYYVDKWPDFMVRDGGAFTEKLELADTLVALCSSGSETGEKDTPYILGIKGQAFPHVPIFHWVVVGEIGLDSFQYSVSLTEIPQSCTNCRNYSAKFKRLAGYP